MRSPSQLSGGGVLAISLLAACLHPAVLRAQGMPSPYPQPQTQAGMVITPPGYPPTQPGYPQPQPMPGFPQSMSSPMPLGPPLPNEPRSTAFANLPTVTIREFRSSVPEVAARGATDMFMTALIRTRKFRVLERARMNEGIAQEKMLNQRGQTTGDAGQSKYVAAGYIFEATVSEASAATERHSIGINIAGLNANKTSTRDTIAIDVRVIDIESGVVLDAIDVRTDIVGEETSAGGLTTAIANTLTRGQGSAVASALAPSDQITSARKQSVDSALRAAIEQAVREIAERFGTQG